MGLLEIQHQIGQGTLSVYLQDDFDCLLHSCDAIAGRDTDTQSEKDTSVTVSVDNDA